MRTAIRSDAPSASDNGTSTVGRDRDLAHDCRASRPARAAPRRRDRDGRCDHDAPRRPLQSRPLLHGARRADTARRSR